MTSIIALTRYLHLQVNICIHVQELKFIKTFAEYAIRLIQLYKSYLLFFLKIRMLKKFQMKIAF